MDDRQCQETVLIRDPYGALIRGRKGFELRYTERRCVRFDVGNGFCWQHQRAKARRLAASSDLGNGGEGG